MISLVQFVFLISPGYAFKVWSCMGLWPLFFRVFCPGAAGQYLVCCIDQQMRKIAMLYTDDGVARSHTRERERERERERWEKTCKTWDIRMYESILLHGTFKEKLLFVAFQFNQLPCGFNVEQFVGGSAAVCRCHWRLCRASVPDHQLIASPQPCLRVRGAARPAFRSIPWGISYRIHRRITVICRRFLFGRRVVVWFIVSIPRCSMYGVLRVCLRLGRLWGRCWSVCHT